MARNSAIRSFANDERGNFGIIFAVIALPVIALAGLGLDYARISRAESQLQSSVDTAIAAAASQGGTVAAMQRTVSDFIESNYEGKGVSVRTFVDTHTMRVQARQNLAMSVLAAVGKPQMEISVDAKLTSRTPLRSTGTSISPALSSQQIGRKKQAFNRAIRRLPPSRQREMRRRFNEHLKFASQQRNRPGSQFYIAE